MKIGALCRRSGFTTRAVAMALACTMVASPALAATQATLGGRIVNATGTPVRGAKVLLLRPGSDNVMLSATTGENGLYVIEKVDTGKYDLRVESGVAGLRGDTAKVEVTDKGLVVNWRLAADKPVALAIPGKVGGEEDELCSPVTVGDYEINRCVLAGGGVLVVGGAIGAAIGLSGGGSDNNTPTITGTRPTASPTTRPATPTITGTRPTVTATVAPPTPTMTGTLPTATATGPAPTVTATTVPPTVTATTVPPTVTATTVPPTVTPTGQKTESVRR
jgi:hypothetical protein